MDHRIEIEGNIQSLINDAYSHTDSFLRSKDYLKWLPKKRNTQSNKIKRISMLIMT